MSKIFNVGFGERFPVFLNVFQGILSLMIILVLLAEGAVRSTPLYLLAVPVFLLAGLAALAVHPAARHRSIYWSGLSMAFVIATWAMFQALGFVGNPFASPVWRAAADVLGPVPGSVSIVPADTIATIIPVLLPFSVYLSTVLLFQSDQSATRFLRFLAVVGGIVALYGLIQYEFFPDYIMFRKKEFYLRDLTSVLVNRNSIATYLGAALLLNAGFFYDSLLPAAPRRGWGGEILYGYGHIRVSPFTILHGSMVFLTLIALLLTRSRAGTAATFVSIFALSIFFVLDGFRRIERRARRQVSQSRRFARAAAAAGFSFVVMAVFIFLGGQVIMRADLQGLEDGRFCAYPSMVELLKENWIFGTGLGSFSEAYKRYQDPVCGKNILWDRAHSFYLEGWIDLGVIFIPLLVFALAVLTVVFWTGVSQRKAMRWVPATGWAVLLLFLLHSIVDFSIQIPGVAVAFAAMMGAASVISLNRGGSSQEQRRDT